MRGCACNCEVLRFISQLGKALERLSSVLVINPSSSPQLPGPEPHHGFSMAMPPLDNQRARSGDRATSCSNEHE